MPYYKGLPRTNLTGTGIQWVIISVFGDSGIYSLVERNGVGDGGNIDILAGSLSLDGGDSSLTHSAQLVSGIAGLNNGSDKNMQVGKGKAGNIHIQAGSVFLSNNALLSSETYGLGDAGSISMQVKDALSVSNSFILSGLREGAVGNGKDTYIKAKSISLTDGGVLSASTGIFTQGNSGNIWLDADDFVNLSGVLQSRGASGGVFTTTEDTARGRAGNITVNTNALRISDAAVLSARTRSAFDGGNITVNVKTLEALNGGQIFTTASSSGHAGNITVIATDGISLSGIDPTYVERFKLYPNTVDTDGSASGLFARTQGVGTGGSLQLTTQQLQVLDGAQVTVSSQATGNAGNLDITARSIKLDNQGKVTAETASSKGGNITLQNLDLLLMRHNSQISATAGTDQNGGGNGGNITIYAPSGFIVALPTENSDIIANAFKGSGGKVDINAAGIFGMTVRTRDDLIRLLNTNIPSELDTQKLITSDISAISQASPTLNGQVIINTPDVDPNRGLVQLPVNLVDASQQIDTRCSPSSRQRASSFTITGRGGLPPNPRNEALSSDAVQLDWVSLKPNTENRSRVEAAKNPNKSIPTPIVEATGWVRNEFGEVVLTAYPTMAPHTSWQTTAFCHGS